MAVGGDIIEATYNHPTLGTGVFYPKAAEDTTFDPGGFRSNDDANMIAGNGEMIDQINRVRWSAEMPIANDVNIRLDIEKAIAMAGDPQPATWTFTHVSGVVYQGTGKPVGDLQANMNQATFTLKVSGGGTLSKI